MRAVHFSQCLPDVATLVGRQHDRAVVRQTERLRELRNVGQRSIDTELGRRMRVGLCLLLGILRRADARPDLTKRDEEPLFVREVANRLATGYEPGDAAMRDTTG